MRNPISPAYLIDGAGFIWASGEWSVTKINKLIRVYRSCGIIVTPTRGLNQ